jgi:hypothetical protein
LTPAASYGLPQKIMSGGAFGNAKMFRNCWDCPASEANPKTARLATPGPRWPVRAHQCEVKAAIAACEPPVSVAAKKRELGGDFKNNGRALRPKGLGSRVAGWYGRASSVFD